RQLVVSSLAIAFAGTLAVCGRGHGTSDGPVGTAPRAREMAHDGWTTGAPRDEIRPEFTYDLEGVANGEGSLIIKADGREGLDGWWEKRFPVSGGKHYQFAARYQATGVAVPRRSIVAALHWRDARGQHVPLDQPAVTDYLR